MTTPHLATGYRFAGIACGIRDDPTRPDLGLVVSDELCVASGVFTQNRVRAAPVRVCQERVPTSEARGVLVCAGNANACTGEQGLRDARRMAELAAHGTECGEEQMLVCSTGIIGVPLPMEKIEAGIGEVIAQLGTSQKHLEAFANSITTTDTRIKVESEKLAIRENEVRLTGVAKGAAMIGPNMATMLAFVFTDAPVQPDDLTRIAKRAAAQTFNCVRVEGHTSTNDTLLLFANGHAFAKDARTPLAGADLAKFESKVIDVCELLARAIAEDAEGASHLIQLDVEGLRDEDDAQKVARAVADSALVKTAIFGADPNWGRIVSAAGYAGVEFEEEHLSLWLGDILLYHEGVPQPFDEETASAYLKREKTVRLRLRFTLGSARCTFWTSDLTYEYVRLNAEYTT